MVRCLQTACAVLYIIIFKLPIFQTYVSHHWRDYFSKGISDFINFPHDLYVNDKYYVPEIYIGQKDMMNPSKFPFHQYGKVKYFLARKDNKIVGRIAAIDNKNYNSYHHCKVGFWFLIS